MHTVIRINLDNDAFQGDNLGPGLAEALIDLAGRVEEQTGDFLRAHVKSQGWIVVKDSNGNKCGNMSFKKGE